MSNTSSLPSSAAPSKSSKNAVIARFIKFLGRVKTMIAARQLPRVAQNTCEVYLEGADKTLQAQCQRFLQTRLNLDPNQVHRFLQTPIGKSLLAWFENFFQWPHEHDSEQFLTDLLVEMAADSEGFSLISAWRHWPETLQLNLDRLLFTAKRVEGLIEATQATTETIRELSRVEASIAPPLPLVDMPDLRRVGDFEVVRSRLLLPGRQQDETYPNETPPLEVVCYAPQPWPSQPTSVIVQSHALASCPDDMEDYAYHLASYGYFVVAPQHPGSDVQQMRRMLTGEVSEVFKHSAFIDRPGDIRYVLDQLGEDVGRSWAGKLNLERVGIMGYSFGAYTALALAGATIHFEALEQACGLSVRDLNLSLLLQCQALALPRQIYSFCDPRIQAVFALDSVGSEVFGTEGLALVSVPVMLVAGSHDMVAPLVLEQIRIFQRLTGADQYLALMHGKPHIRDMQRFIRALAWDIDWSPQLVPATPSAALVEAPIAALSVAFFDQYLRPEKSDTRYLSADYGTFLSQSPYDIWLISEKSKPALNHALQAPVHFFGRHPHATH